MWPYVTIPLNGHITGLTVYWCLTRFPYYIVFILFNWNMAGDTSWEGTSYPVRSPDFTLSFQWGLCYSIFSVRSPDFTLSFQWGLCYSIFRVRSPDFTLSFQWGLCYSIFSVRSPDFTLSFQWGSCYSIFSFLCKVS
jgi:hypothetical protein